MAQKWGVPVTDSCLHALTHRLGARAEASLQRQMETSPQEREPQRAPTKLAVLMLDGWQVRQRGPGWGRRKTQEPRVEWHEWKTGVSYRHEHSAVTAGDRRVLAEKVVVGWQGDPMEFGRRLHWEAQAAGLGRAKARLVAGDGAPWIWNVARDRWPGATEVLDFYHASQHLWELGRALHKDDEAATAAWVEPRRHHLRHGGEKKVLADLAGLKRPRGPAGQAVQREQNYFATHARRMNYRNLPRRGWPIGSGPVESACRQRQCRFKRSGQFWTPKDALYDLMGFDKVGKMFEKGAIEIAPLAYMRGRTLNHSFIILDEAQNTTPEQMKMFLTRMGFGAKAVVTGDLTQVDLPRGAKSGLKEAVEILEGVRGIAFTRFVSDDVVRHPLVGRIVEAYEAHTARIAESGNADVVDVMLRQPGRAFGRKAG